MKESTINIEAVVAAELLKDHTLMAHLAELTTQAFTYHNPNLSAAYEAQTDEKLKAEFLELSREQLFDSIRQIAKAAQIDKKEGILFLARDTSKAGQSVVGIISGVGNGNPHPSHEYFGRLFASKSGLGEAIGNAFGSVLGNFELSKMEQYKNVFMLGMLAVEPSYMHRGVATQLTHALHAELKGKYDGVFSIVTSPRALGLLEKLTQNLAVGEFPKLIKMQDDASGNCFFGIAFNEKGEHTFNLFNTVCRKTPDELAAEQQAQHNSPRKTI
ncbi:MAG TPA: hypothetical protein VGV92_04440 [Gammaproteobacteria bacterium]|nr:hypothetical protein [Gammaproteobacteria bacterium]